MKGSLKQFTFYLILTGISFIVLILIEISLRVFHFGYDLRLFKESSINKDYLELNPNVTRRFFFNSPGTEPYPEMFLRIKPDSSYRIFVLGESSAQGFPYRRNGSFPSMLQYLLQQTFPHKRIEVVNVSMAAINSYALLDFIDEIIAHHPDLIIIYAGHNEYYGALGVASAELGRVPRMVKKLHLYLVRLRLYQLIQSIIRKISAPSFPHEGTLMNRIARKAVIGYRSKNYDMGLLQFRLNMQQLLQKTHSKNIPVILSTLVSNVRDLPPLGKDSANNNAWRIFDSARILEMKGKLSEAQKMYYLAKDMDDIRFRAPEDINKIIEELANQFNYPLVNMKKAFELCSPHGIPGDPLIIDHLHPNIEGYWLMAYTYYRLIVESNNFHPIEDTVNILSKCKKSYPISLFDTAYGNLSVQILKSDWPFSNDSKRLYINTYHPSSCLDSLLLQTFLHNTSAERSQYLYAQEQEHAGNQLTAVVEYRSLLQKYPYYSTFYCILANLYERMGLPVMALQTLQSYPDRDKHPEILENIIRISITLKDFKEAKFYLQIIGNLSLTPKLAQRVNSYKVSINQPEHSKPVFRSIVVEPQAKNYLEKASTLIAERNYDAALAILQHSLTIQNTYIAHFFIGSILLKKGKTQEAVAELEEAYKLDKNDPQLLHNLVLAYIKLKKYKQAVQLLEIYKKVAPEDSVKILKLKRLLPKQLT